jgi:hypothetical protein
MTTERMLELKKEAWALKKATELTHMQALDYLADREGFGNWNALLRATYDPSAGSLYERDAE